MISATQEYVCKVIDSPEYMERNLVILTDPGHLKEVRDLVASYDSLEWDASIFAWRRANSRAIYVMHPRDTPPDTDFRMVVCSEVSSLPDSFGNPFISTYLEKWYMAEKW